MKEFFEDNDLSLLKLLTVGQFDYQMLIIGETLNHYNTKLPSGFSVVIDLQIPIGSGMGSSAALAVALTGALTVFLKKEFLKEKINEIAFRAEQYIHGFPSGGDTSASCYGGFIWFRKETDKLKIIQPIDLFLSEKIANNFFIIDTGAPKESTGEMVASVRKLVGKRQIYADKIFTEQERLTRNLLSALQNNDEATIIKTIKSGERNLEKLGVVSPFVKKQIQKIEELGGAAKICGGGGKTKSTGVVLLYQNTPSQITYDTVHLGEEGVTIHE